MVRGATEAEPLRRVGRYEVWQLRDMAGEAREVDLVADCDRALRSQEWPPSDLVRARAYRTCQGEILSQRLAGRLCGSCGAQASRRARCPGCGHLVGSCCHPLRLESRQHWMCSACEIRYGWREEAVGG